MRVTYGPSLFSLAIVFIGGVAHADPQTAQFKNKERALTFEVLDDQIFHFEYSTLDAATNPQTTRIKTTPFIRRLPTDGPGAFSTSGHSFQTARTQVQVDPVTLCYTVYDSFRKQMLTRVCPVDHGLTLDQLKMQNVYGLGEQFRTPGDANGDWLGKVRTPGCKYGNSLPQFGGGYTGNVQIPVLYALGPDSLNYGFYVDTVYPLSWDFTSPTWKVNQTLDSSDPAFRGFFILGDDLPMLRENFMDLVGHPLVPPKKAFGLWVSEFGYRNWGEVDDKLSTLRDHKFPVDGFVLDVYWFGGYEKNSPGSEIGTLDWDLKNFPDPKKKVASYWDNDGVSLMLSEQSYIGQNLANFTSMSTLGLLAKAGCASCATAINNDWWGQGGMIDWTNPQAGAVWHNEHRKKLTDIGVTFHWTDLGEPEMFNENNYYAGLDGIGHLHPDVHNAYNFLWHQSIFQGYESNHEQRRHFILSRSGAPGLQRFGSALWSGDIGSNLKSLSAHLDAQMHLSMSGIDYYGADVGGFHRGALEGPINEVYTKWLAHAALFDVPIRPHTDNGSKQFNTAPDRVGDMASNLFNIRQRYELAPYYYNLAYRAWLFGEPVLPPLIFYYQNDPNVRILAEEKMIGRDLIAATAAQLGEFNRGVYLPAGDWVDYHTGNWFHSQGQWFANFPLIQDDVFRLPLFVRAGAIIPKAHVDDQTMNILGKRLDGTRDTDLVLRVYASRNSSDMNVLEDDGVTENYRRHGAYSATEVQQLQTSQSEIVTILPTLGSYDGAPTQRIFRVELVVENKKIHRLLLNDRALKFFSDPTDLDDASEGWSIDPRGVVLSKTDHESASDIKKFEFEFSP